MTRGAVSVRELLIGVTGHREFEMADTVPRVDRLLDTVVDHRRAVVVSSLAEGADRLVAERVLARPGSGLEVILPLKADDYEHDFATTESIADFRALLSRADSVSTVTLPPTARREEAYERAGHEMVDRCEVLIALWDGAPSRGRGGTASTIDYARAAGRRVEIVTVTREPSR